MDLVIKEFLSEVDVITHSSIFAENDNYEPKTEWIEEIDSRTNFPFYWNSNTKESVWDMPKEYNEYLVKYETYLRDLVLKCDEMRQKELENDNNRNKNDMKGLIEYSDSEDDEIMENVEKVNDVTDKIEEVLTEKLSPEEEETEEDLLLKKETWMNEQVDEAEKYLKSLIKKMSETIKNKIDALIRDGFGNGTLKDISIRVMTRLEDWAEGYLALERKVDKLKESLIEISRFEASLETDKWKLHWNNDKNRYFCICNDSGKILSELSSMRNSFEDGEIVEDEDDLALDLEEYVCTTLYRSLLNENQENDGKISDNEPQIRAQPEVIQTEFILDPDDYLSEQDTSEPDQNIVESKASSTPPIETEDSKDLNEELTE